MSQDQPQGGMDDCSVDNDLQLSLEQHLLLSWYMHQL